MGIQWREVRPVKLTGDVAVGVRQQLQDTVEPERRADIIAQTDEFFDKIRLNEDENVRKEGIQKALVFIAELKDYIEQNGGTDD